MALTRPSIKGTAFVSAVGDLQALVEAGRISEEQLEARLPTQDLAILESKILPGDWYPIESYGRIIDRLGEIEGGGAAYHIQRGRRAAERLLQSGIYRQLDRAIVQRDRATLERQGRDKNALIAIMLTVGRTLYNFGAWELLRDQCSDTRLCFELRQMAALPENARLTIQGFVEWAARHIGSPHARVECRRLSADRIQFDIHGT
jgi:hypothetical protein